MKIVKFAIRIWLTVASVASFAAGWIMLVHAPKPVQIFAQAAPVPTLAPLPSLSDPSTGGNNSINQFFNVQPQRRSFFRTGGS
jgi:hypothetical protein